MFDLALKDSWGHKVRSFLTILGIVIAIATVVSLGSVSEGLRVLAAEQLSFSGDLIIVVEEGFSDSARGPPVNLQLDIDLVDEFKSIPGVDTVEPIMFRQITPELMLVSIDQDNLELFNLGNLETTKGTFPETGELEIMLGTEASDRLDLAVGDIIKIENQNIEIVGIIEETGSFLDFSVFTSIETMQGMSDALQALDEQLLPAIAQADSDDFKCTSIDDVPFFISAKYKSHCFGMWIYEGKLIVSDRSLSMKDKKSGTRIYSLEGVSPEQINAFINVSFEEQFESHVDFQQ